MGKMLHCVTRARDAIDSQLRMIIIRGWDSFSFGELGAIFAPSYLGQTSTNYTMYPLPRQYVFSTI